MDQKGVREQMVQCADFETRWKRCDEAGFVQHVSVECGSWECGSMCSYSHNQSYYGIAKSWKAKPGNHFQGWFLMVRKMFHRAAKEIKSSCFNMWCLDGEKAAFSHVASGLAKTMFCAFTLFRVSTAVVVCKHIFAFFLHPVKSRKWWVGGCICT